MKLILRASDTTDYDSHYQFWAFETIDGETKEEVMIELMLCAEKHHKDYEECRNARDAFYNTLMLEGDSMEAKASQWSAWQEYLKAHSLDERVNFRGHKISLDYLEDKYDNPEIFSFVEPTLFTLEEFFEAYSPHIPQ